MKLIHNDLITGKTITASSEASGYPATAVEDIRASRRWRSTGDTSEWVKIDMGSAVNVKGAAIIGHNLTSGATIKVQANSSDSWTSPPVDVTITYKAGVMWYFWSSNQNYRWWRFTFADASNPDTYIAIGRLMLSVVYELPEFPDRDLAEEIVDPSALAFSVSQQLYADIRTKYRIYSIGLGTLKESTRQSILSLYELTRAHDPFVLLLDENNTDKLEPIYCAFNKPPGFTHVGGWAWRDDKLEFREVF